MPHIIVMADAETGRGGETVMLRERIHSSDLRSQHFSRQLLERLGWAVGDAQQAESEAPTRNTAEPRPTRPTEPVGIRGL